MLGRKKLMTSVSFTSHKNPHTSVFAVETTYEYITIVFLDHVVWAEIVDRMKV